MDDDDNNDEDEDEDEEDNLKENTINISNVDYNIKLVRN